MFLALTTFDRGIQNNQTSTVQASDESSKSPEIKLLEEVLALCERLVLQEAPSAQIKLSLELMVQVRLLGNNDPVVWEDLFVACQTCAVELANRRSSLPPLMISDISQQVSKVFQQ